MMKKLLQVLMLMLLTLAVPCLALAGDAGLPLAEDQAQFEAFVEALVAEGMDATKDVEATLDLNNYDGVDYVTVTYAPLDGLTYSLDYEDGVLYMAFVSIAPDSSLYEEADKVLLPLFRQFDPLYEADAAEMDFIGSLRESGEMAARNGRSFQILSPMEGGQGLAALLNVMIYEDGAF